MIINVANEIVSISPEILHPFGGSSQINKFGHYYGHNFKLTGTEINSCCLNIIVILKFCGSEKSFETKRLLFI